MCGVPGVARRRERQCEIRSADRELVCLLLAEQDGTRVTQPHPGLGILVRHMVEIARRARRRADTARLVDVLEADRDTVQRAARRLIGASPRVGKRLVMQYQDIAVQFAVEGGDPVEIGLRQHDRRKPARADRLARFGDGQLRRVHRLAQTLGCTKMCAGSAARSRGRRTVRAIRSTSG